VEAGPDVVGKTVSIGWDTDLGVCGVVKLFSGVREFTVSSVAGTAVLTGSGFNSIFFLSLLREKSCCLLLTPN